MKTAESKENEYGWVERQEAPGWRELRVGEKVKG